MSVLKQKHPAKKENEIKNCFDFFPLFPQAGVLMLTIRRASSRKLTCCTGTVHSNPGVPLPFTQTCGRSGSSQTLPGGSPYFGLTQTDERCRIDRGPVVGNNMTNESLKATH